MDVCGRSFMIGCQVGECLQSPAIAIHSLSLRLETATHPTVAVTEHDCRGDYACQWIVTLLDHRLLKRGRGHLLQDAGVGLVAEHDEELAQLRSLQQLLRGRLQLQDVRRQSLVLPGPPCLMRLALDP